MSSRISERECQELKGASFMEKVASELRSKSKDNSHVGISKQSVRQCKGHSMLKKHQGGQYI